MWICVFVSFNFFRFFFPFERTKINLFSSMGVCMASEKYHPIKTEIKLTIRKILPGARRCFGMLHGIREIFIQLKCVNKIND